jgi:hypothetical protein
VLDRHNRILGELARVGQPVVLLTTGYSEISEPTRSYPELVELDPAAVLWRTVAMHRADVAFSDPSYWHIFATKRKWRPGEFDAIVRLVADETLVNVLIVSPDCRWVLHPYDGGMDVIVESREARNRLGSTYRGWLSANPSGL